MKTEKIDFKKLGGPEVILYPGAIDSLAGALTDKGIKSVFVFADKNTYSAAGEKVVKVLCDGGIKTKKYIFKAEKIFCCAVS